MMTDPIRALTFSVLIVPNETVAFLGISLVLGCFLFLGGKLILPPRFFNALRYQRT